MAKRHEPLTLFNRDSLTSFVAGGFAGAGEYPLHRKCKQHRADLTSIPGYEHCKKFVTSHGFELNTYTRLASGAAAGIVSVTVTYPLDLVRARLSVASASFSRLNSEQHATSSQSPMSSSSSSKVALHPSGASKSLHTSASRAASTVISKVPGVWEMMLKVAREEGGVRALYRGLVPTALGVAPYNGINFAAYELLKEIITPKNNPEKQTTPRRLLTGALSGTISQTLTYPLDVLRRKSQMASAKGFSKYNGAIDAAKKTLQTEGIVGLYRGMWPNLIKVAPAMATSFYVYETVKSFLKSWMGPPPVPSLPS
ncbi:hypothetical protein FRC17_009242 [Serendipita sp. 399]|nr:hypothetical protein FRC17_009242 [Serendipita sp. 399]